MIAPRPLIIQHAPHAPQHTRTLAKTIRKVAAPGTLAAPTADASRAEANRAAARESHDHLTSPPPRLPRTSQCPSNQRPKTRFVHPRKSTTRDRQRLRKLLPSPHHRHRTPPHHRLTSGLPLRQPGKIRSDPRTATRRVLEKCNRTH
jgi:hypothetical protein